MECLGPQCATMLLEWLRSRAEPGSGSQPTGLSRQGTLWTTEPYQDDAPSLRSDRELDSAVEHLGYAIYRRYQNQLTRAERARLDNTIANALYKVDRYLERLSGDARVEAERKAQGVRQQVRDERERSERLRRQARRADLKLAQLSTLTAEGFEEFVAEVFEALGYAVEAVGGTGDEGADLRLVHNGLRAVVQCKYHSRGVIGSAELQKFLGTVHHTGSHKGFFVTTRTFSLAAEKFVADHPIELIDGPRLVELVQDAIGPGAKQPAENAWF